MIIIGGGISGLVAARRLSINYEITILEALPRFGGRIYTLNKNEMPAKIEAGAEFVHGEAVETIKLLQEAGITFAKTEGDFYSKKGNFLKKDDRSDNGWDFLLEKMGTITADITLQEFLKLYFSEPQFEDLCQQAISFAQGFDLADIDKVSVKSLYQEWANQSEDYRINGGYGQLVGFLVNSCIEKGCTLIANAEVKKIRWKKGNVEILTINETLYKADQCLITVPLGILQKGILGKNFEPAIADYIAAAQQIGFGSVLKVILSFKQQFWQDGAAFFLSNEEIPTWWTQFPALTPILTGWAGGPKAVVLSTFSKEEIIEKAIDSLSMIFKLSKEDLKKAITGCEVFNWHLEPSFLGAYSYATPETAAALEILRQPIQNTLFFAGEAMYSGPNPGTVEAAIVSALQAAESLLK